MTEILTLTQPDDWHIHLRDSASLALTVAHAAAQFKRAIVMPNLVPPITDADKAMAYRQRILDARPQGNAFEPLMVLYLTDNTTPSMIREAQQAGVVACKLYPSGATTHSEFGVTRIENTYACLETMSDIGMKLLVHGEVTDSHIDIFDREAVFIDRTLSKLVERFPQLKIVFEHITTAEAVAFVRDTGPSVAATITAHHLLYNRNHMLAGGIRPHFYCLPILKRGIHQDALIGAATSGSAKFFLGTDSAPHARNKKEAACGCAGAYTAYAAIELYAEAFEQADALNKLEAFASHFGPDFYGLPRNTDTITLHKTNWTAPQEFLLGEDLLTPLRAGESLSWRLLTP